MSVGLDMSAAQMLRHGRDVLFTLCVIVELVFGRVMPALALDQVSLQLKWKHQFQFAGYYAAVEKGFYRDNGLEVALREGGPSIDAGAEVAKGAADFGVCTTSVVVNSAERANNVVLGVIFQHSAAIILVPHRAGIHAVSELKGHELMDAPRQR
jgi:ABC-type nitrate/sulfonate/bicarbonate transport system substrate-binding protein